MAKGAKVAAKVEAKRAEDLKGLVAKGNLLQRNLGAGYVASANSPIQPVQPFVVLAAKTQVGRREITFGPEG